MTPVHQQALSGFRHKPLAAGLALALSFVPYLAPEAYGLPLSAHITPNHDAVIQMRTWLTEHPGIRSPKMQRGGGTTLPVSSCGDDGGPGTLRAVINMAADGDTVDMRGLDCDFIVLHDALLFNQDLELIGDGSINITVDPPSNGIIAHLGTGNLVLTGLTLSGGEHEVDSPGLASGGCVYSNGAVVLDHTVLQSCKATNHDGNAYGGAVFARHHVSMFYSVITGAEADAGPNGQGVGGAVYTPDDFVMKYSTIDGNEASGGTLGQAGGVWTNGFSFIRRSTISRNVAQNVGGLVVTTPLAEHVDIFIVSSTIAGNVSTGHPTLDVCGAIFLRTTGDVSIENSTISGNLSFEDFGAGLCIDTVPDTTLFTSSIISGNLYLQNDVFEFFPSDLLLPDGVTVTGDYNVIGDIDLPEPADSYELSGVTYHETFSAEGFGDHGGPTATIAIPTGSWAFQHGAFVANPSEVFPNTDQRLLPREIGHGVDIGAYESDSLFIGRFDFPPWF